MQIISPRIEAGGTPVPGYLDEPAGRPAIESADESAVESAPVAGPIARPDAAPGSGVAAAAPPAPNPDEGSADGPAARSGRGGPGLRTHAGRRAAPARVGGPEVSTLAGAGALVLPALPGSIVPPTIGRPSRASSNASPGTNGPALGRTAASPAGVGQRTTALEPGGVGFAAWLAALIAEGVPDRAAASSPLDGNPGAGVAEASGPRSGDGRAAPRRDRGPETTRPGVTTPAPHPRSAEAVGVEPAAAARAVMGRPIADGPPDILGPSILAVPDAEGPGPRGDGGRAGSEARRAASGSPPGAYPGRGDPPRGSSGAPVGTPAAPVGTPAAPLDPPASGAIPAARAEAPARSRPGSRGPSATRLDPSPAPTPIPEPPAPSVADAASPTGRADGDVAAAAQAPAPTDADRLLGTVAERIRLAIRDRLPTLEATFHDPTLGSVRLAVRGLPDGPIEAVVVVANQAAARGLERAVRDADRRSTDLLGIELRIRVEPASSAPVAADPRPEHRPHGHPGAHGGWEPAGSAGGDSSARRDPAGADAGLGPDGGGRRGDPSTPDGPVVPSGSARRGRSTGPTPAPAAGPGRGSVAARSGGIDIRL